MISLRHKQSWLAWIVGLTLVVSGVLSPVQAFACAERPGMVQSGPADGPSKHCASMGQQGSCCCKPGDHLTQAHPAPLGVALSSAGCGCAVHAPDTTPAPATKTAALVFSPEVALLTVSSLEIELPRSAPWVFAAPATGPPQAPLRSTGPSRAPPAL